mgnify:CR=1 FL=1
MQYIHIINWQKYQHYKNRRPPWIKLYSKLLRKYEFLCLQDDSKLLLIFLWLLASTIEQDDPLIPSDVSYLKQQLPLKGKINLQPLVQQGFIELIAGCKQNDSNLPQIEAPYTETETETEKKRKETELRKEEFEKEFWPNVPVKIGKGDARDAYVKARKKTSKDEILAGLPKYKDYEAGRSKQVDYRPLHPATWLNQERWTDVVPHKETTAEIAARYEAGRKGILK